MITIQEAVSRAKREFLHVEGVVGVSYYDNTLVFYVERPEDAAKVPRTYYGYPVAVKVVGRIAI